MNQHVVVVDYTFKISEMIPQIQHSQINTTHTVHTTNSVNYNDEYHKIGFAIDIDGTLVLSHQEIPGSSQALNVLTAEGVPYILVTNNISHSEQTKANDLNKMLKLNVPITSDQIILNITPLKKYMKWDDKVILIVIRQNQAPERLPFEEIPKYITIDEYCTIFPNSVPLSRRTMKEEAMAVKARVEKRLGLQKLDQHTLQFGAILVLNCPLRWEECYQIIMDLLSSEDGSLKDIKQYSYVENHIPILTALNDMHFLTRHHPLPRLLIKPFNEGLRSIYKQIYGKDLKLITFGKPEANTFSYIEKFMANKYGKVNKIVMVGDNEQTDILGAHRYGWESVLVKTGISKQDSQMATYNCNTLLQAFAKYGFET